MRDAMESTEGAAHGERLRSHCLAKPDAVEDHPWGDTVFKIRGKIFAGIGERSVTVKASPDDLDGLLALEIVERAPYVGRYGWVVVEVQDEEALDLALSLIDTSYDLVSKRKR
jgi:predicted DNA-binding protein (MmcQ/YjbR family)